MCVAVVVCLVRLRVSLSCVVLSDRLFVGSSYALAVMIYICKGCHHHLVLSLDERDFVMGLL